MAVLDKQFYKQQIKRSQTGTYRAHGDPARADCVLASGFGYRHAPDGSALPSLTTRQIAAYLRNFEHLPKIVTHDLGVAYRKLGPCAEDLLYEIERPAHQTAVHLASQFRDHMRELNCAQGLLIGHQHHLPWLDYLCGQISVPTIVPHGLQFAFDPVSAQPWTRDAESWRNEIQQRLQLGYDDTFHPETYRLHHGPNLTAY